VEYLFCLAPEAKGAIAESTLDVHGAGATHAPPLGHRQVALAVHTEELLVSLDEGRATMTDAALEILFGG